MLTIFFLSAPSRPSDSCIHESKLLQKPTPHRSRLLKDLDTAADVLRYLSQEAAQIMPSKCKNA